VYIESVVFYSSLHIHHQIVHTSHFPIFSRPKPGGGVYLWGPNKTDKRKLSTSEGEEENQFTYTSRTVGPSPTRHGTNHIHFFHIVGALFVTTRTTTTNTTQTPPPPPTELQQQPQILGPANFRNQNMCPLHLG